MSDRCCIETCCNWYPGAIIKRSKDNVSLYSFPTDTIKISQWKFLIKKLNQQTKYPKIARLKICSLHFDADCFKLRANSRSLKPDAYPKYFPRLNHSVDYDKILFDKQNESSDSDSDGEIKEDDKNKEENEFKISDDDEEDNSVDGNNEKKNDDGDNDDDDDDGEIDVNEAKYGIVGDDFDDESDLLNKKKKDIIRAHQKSMLRATQLITDLRRKNGKYRKEIRLMHRRITHRDQRLKKLGKMLSQEKKKIDLTN